VICPNCGAGLDGAFCATCGQKAGPLNPSLRDVLHNFVEEVLNIDGKTFQSVWLLLTNPGFLSLEQFQGRRARYVSPIRLYLLLSLLYFAVAALAPSSILPVTIKARPDDPPQEIQRLEQQRRAIEAAASPALVEWVPRAMFVLVPLFAGLVAFSVRGSGWNYPQHLYFALHVHAVWFFAYAVAGAFQIRTIPIMTPLVWRIAGLYVVVYLVLAFRRAYGLNITGALLRSVAVGVSYMVLLGAALLAILYPLGVFERR
jgi:Protein of unknown function (DUF3667)